MRRILGSGAYLFETLLCFAQPLLSLSRFLIGLVRLCMRLFPRGFQALCAGSRFSQRSLCLLR
ncbi:MAG: hypothetical protein DMF61_21045 [Blastocatellia bacterium AA13]|nr:MAG: hypothetical protein DMF61_21045 [Blastocatellia bacterium AA13]